MLNKTIDNWLFRAYRRILANTLSNQATVLMFHRVQLDKKTDFDEYISAEEFRLKMILLKKHFNVISLPSLIALLKINELPPLSVVVTIDDGYEDGYSIITPILDDLDIKGAFFIATEGIERGGLWNDRIINAIMHTDVKEVDLSNQAGKINLSTQNEKLAAWKIIHNKYKFLTLDERNGVLDELESKLNSHTRRHDFLSKEQLSEMHNAGMTIGAHTHRHPILSVETNDSAYFEIRKSKEILEQIINSEVKYFAYPNGKFGRDFEDKHKKMVKELGFEAALTTEIGLVNNRSDLMSIPRFTPWDKEPASFALRLCHHFYKLK